jgi:predicted ferric reductase
MILVLIFPVILGILTMPGLGSGTILLFHLSRLGALLGLVFLGVQIVLGIKLKFIETCFGHDKMIVLHSQSVAGEQYSKQPGLAGFLDPFRFKLLGHHHIKVRGELLMCKNRFQVAKVVQETPTIWTIQFQPRKLDFKPAQFMILRLIQNGTPSEPHPFTIAASPTAGELAVSIKAVGDFTRTIKDVKPGDSALIDAPYGKFSFLEFPAEEYLFIAGGIGITPFMSMLRYLRDMKMSKKIVLLWGNRFEREIAFREELTRMEAVNPGLRVIHVISDEPDWPGEKGFITAALIQKYGGDLSRKEIFICGPPVMLDLMLKELQALNIPKERIHYERFTF